MPKVVLNKQNIIIRELYLIIQLLNFGASYNFFSEKILALILWLSLKYNKY